MSRELLSKVSKDSQANRFRIISLRSFLLREIAGNKLGSPTYYIQIKREFGITGSRKNIVKQLTRMIEDAK
jgi:hypothetical protein